MDGGCLVAGEIFGLTGKMIDNHGQQQRFAVGKHLVTRFELQAAAVQALQEVLHYPADAIELQPAGFFTLVRDKLVQVFQGLDCRR